jgi:hypothetical protein
MGALSWMRLPAAAFLLVAVMEATYPAGAQNLNDLREYSEAINSEQRGKPRRSGVGCRLPKWLVLTNGCGARVPVSRR